MNQGDVCDDVDLEWSIMGQVYSVFTSILWTNTYIYKVHKLLLLLTYLDYIELDLDLKQWCIKMFYCRGAPASVYVRE